MPNAASARLVLIAGVVTALSPSLIAAVFLGLDVVAATFPIYGLLPGLVAAGISVGALRFVFRRARPSILLCVVVTLPSILLSVALTLAWTILAWGKGPP